MDGSGQALVPPLGLYVHYPWCLQKCPYCDFNSHAQGRLADGDYVQALLADLKAQLDGQPVRPIGSIFIGGGTPSLLSGPALAELLQGIAGLAELSAQLEISLEANPGAVDAGHFAAYRAAGVNRLSIGVQSFDDGCLRRIGRVHDAAQALRAIELARAAGFDNLNIDLMFGLPGQTQAQALADLHQALALGPEHLSWYQLSLEPNTPFYHSPPSLPDDESLADIQEQGQGLLEQAGLRQYEVSAYARPGRACGHNLNYWRFGDYLGIGAGAHGKLTQAPGRIRRYARPRGPSRYLANPAARPSYRILSASELPLEFMLNALRLKQGVDLGLFGQRTGLDPAVIAAPLQQAHDLGLLRPGPERIQASPLGWRFLNDLIGLFAEQAGP
ncbi:MAG: radical SAM family heme chaperone HemW [Gammaproteobacteria bacterium SHHR-1]|uniref:radical SAM family heme chaperone HemW n=1 Tax=Magnetovirga frankeli TaxID=947516 RepID=UPI00329382AE